MKRCYHRGLSWLEPAFANWLVLPHRRLMPLIVCVSPQTRWTQDTITVKNIWIFILKSSRNSLLSSCLTGADGKQASIPVSWGVLLHLPHAHSPLSWMSVSAGSGLTTLHFAPSATNTEVSLPFWLLNISLLLQCVYSSTSIQWHTQLSLYDLYHTWQKKVDKKIRYFPQSKNVLSKICLSWSVNYFIRTWKPFHPMLYTLILILFISIS